MDGGGEMGREMRKCLMHNRNLISPFASLDTSVTKFDSRNLY